MQLRYDFVSDKLDLSRFQKQAGRHIISMRQLTYYFYFQDYKLEVDIDTPDDTTSHIVTVHLMELKRDDINEIEHGHMLTPANDIRFKEIKDITNIFPIDTHEAKFESSSVDHTTQKLCSLIKIVYKINSLKVFL